MRKQSVFFIGFILSVIILFPACQTAKPIPACPYPTRAVEDTHKESSWSYRVRIPAGWDCDTMGAGWLDILENPMDFPLFSIQYDKEKFEALRSGDYETFEKIYADESGENEHYQNFQYETYQGTHGGIAQVTYEYVPGFVPDEICYIREYFRLDLPYNTLVTLTQTSWDEEYRKKHWERSNGTSLGDIALYTLDSLEEGANGK